MCFWPIDGFHLRRALGRNPQVWPYWRHSDHGLFALLHAVARWARLPPDHHHFTSAFNSSEKILKLRLVSETGLALVTITAAFPLTFIAHFLICDYFWQSVKLQMLSIWAIYSGKHGNNWQFCEAMICSSTSIWRLVDWSHGKASPLGMLLSCPKVGNSSPHHFNDNSQWWKLWIGSAVWCDNWRCLRLTVLRLRLAYFHCKSVSFAVLSCLSFKEWLDLEWPPSHHQVGLINVH